MIRVYTGAVSQYSAFLKINILYYPTKTASLRVELIYFPYAVSRETYEMVHNITLYLYSKTYILILSPQLSHKEENFDNIRT